MNHRETMQSLLAGEKPQTIPLWIMGFSGQAAVKNLIPKELIYPFYYEYPSDDEYGFESIGIENIDRQILFNNYIDRPGFPIGRGTNASFGHCGPGEFNKKIIEKSINHMVVEYETGAKKKIQYEPWFTHSFDLPVSCEEDLDKLNLPDPSDPLRYEGFKQDVMYAKSRGEWTVGWINGVFSSVHYFLMEYQDFFMGLALEPEFMKKLLSLVGNWTLKVEEMLCRCGVDCIGFCDDLGSNDSMLISPQMYREFVMPWHQNICDVAHGYGVSVHMHSHGNIMPVLKDIASMGVDILNPLDPDDNMPLDEVRSLVPEKTVLCGGMDKHFFDWTEEVQFDFLKKLLDKGKKTGSFILMDSAGIPDNVTKEQFDTFMQMNRSLR
jgi:uroporphyrinogen-III decarboxylase